VRQAGAEQGTRVFQAQGGGIATGAFFGFYGHGWSR
jgi:hypothetical protein